MKKYLVIGNPIEHSMSPKIHNYWIKQNNLNAIYEKKQITESDLKGLIAEVKKGKIDGVNVTVPFKNKIISFLDQLTELSKSTQSVNTIYKKNDKIIGDNTDIFGFESSLKNINYDIKNKKIFILGAGGVVPSIVFVLKKLGASKITLTNRTREKAESIKKMFPGVEIVEWGKVADFNMIINATSLGLKKEDEIKLNFSEIGSNKLFFDVIYSPPETKFLSKAKEFGNQIENGRMMFIYQAQAAFKIWHNILPKIDNNILN